MRPILLLADKLWPNIGGVESHGEHFIRHFSKHPEFPLLGVVSRSEDGRDILIRDGQFDSSPHAVHQALRSAAIIFYNSGRWIQRLDEHRLHAPGALTVYRTGGNEILKADMSQPAPEAHAQRQAWWAGAINRNINLLVTNSEFTERRLRKTGIATRFLRAVGGADSAARATRGKGGRIVLLCAARFVPYKNHMLLVRTVLELLKHGLDLELRLAGDGQLLAETKRTTDATEYRHAFAYLGRLSNAEVIEQMGQADYYIQFSTDHRVEVPGGSYIHSECMGRSILEAIASGVPVIALDSGALREVVTNSRGMLLRPASPDALATTLLSRMTGETPRYEPTDRYAWRQLFGIYEDAWRHG